MDFHPVAIDTAKQVMPAIKYILGLDATPADKKTSIVKVLNLIGADFYTQMFDANSTVFDSTAIGTVDYSEMTDQVERLAQKVMRQYTTGRQIEPLIKSFYDSALGQAQSEAFQNAISLNKHPTLERTMVGETCTWCEERAGVHIYPTSDLFRRHANCDCLLVASGYNSRNGVVNNYVKDKQNTSKDRTDNLELSGIFNDIKPGMGTVEREKGLQIPKNKVHEKNVLEWLKGKVGGNYVILDEANGHNMPDATRNNDAIIEIKRFSSLTSVGNRTKKALDQLDSLAQVSARVPTLTQTASRILLLDGQDAILAAGLSTSQISDAVRRKIAIARESGQPSRIDYVIVKRAGKPTYVFKP